MSLLIDRTADDIVDAVIDQNAALNTRDRATQAIFGMLGSDGCSTTGQTEKALKTFAALIDADLGPTSRTLIVQALSDLVEEGACDGCTEEVRDIQKRLEALM